MNLINNSHDSIRNFSDKWIVVEFKLTRDNKYLYCSISDSGKGIPKEIISKLMQPFFTTKDAGKGTGLGLSISKSIIEAHNGFFYFDENSPNTKFIFEIPLQSKRA